MYTPLRQNQVSNARIYVRNLKIWFLAVFFVYIYSFWGCRDLYLTDPNSETPDLASDGNILWRIYIIHTMFSILHVITSLIFVITWINPNRLLELTAFWSGAFIQFFEFSATLTYSGLALLNLCIEGSLWIGLLFRRYCIRLCITAAISITLYVLWFFVGHTTVQILTIARQRNLARNRDC